MKVKDLIKALEECNPEAAVMVNTECEGFDEATDLIINSEKEIYIGQK